MDDDDDVDEAVVVELVDDMDRVDEVVVDDVVDDVYEVEEVELVLVEVDVLVAAIVLPNPHRTIPNVLNLLFITCSTSAVFSVGYLHRCRCANIVNNFGPLFLDMGYLINIAGWRNGQARRSRG